MPLTTKEARDEALGRFKTVWDADALSTGWRVLYWDDNQDPPTSGNWARVTMRHATGRVVAIGGKMAERNGTLTVQLFAEAGDGLSTVDDLATVVNNAFEGHATPGGVLFENVRINEIGHDGRWFNVNVLADFEYCTIRS